MQAAKQLSVSLVNKPGRLADVLTALNKEKVNLRALVVMDCGERGTVRFVPDDVAVVGYDNLGSATTTSPTLTTIVNPVVLMARTAGELLIDLLAGKRVDRAPVIFAPELVVRLSA